MARNETRVRFYVEITVDPGRPPNALAIKHALDDADAHGALSPDGCGHVQDISVWPMQRRPRMAQRSPAPKSGSD